MKAAKPSDPARRKAAAEAAAWHARLADESATEQDWLGFERWLGQPQNKAEYDRLERAVATVDAHRDELRPAVEVAPHASRRQAATARPAIWIGSVLALAAAALMALYLRPAPPPPELAYAAPPASDRVVTLADATVVHLNRGAEIRAQLGERGRKVMLARGEASFVVSHDQSRPFVVVVGDTEVRDIGTEFDVLKHETGLVVTVRRGEVEIASPRTVPRRIREGDQARVERSGAVSVTGVNADDAFAWQSGRLIYHDAPLAGIIEDLNRYGARRIVVADTQTGALRFSGVLAIDDSAVMLRRLEAFLPIRSEQDGDRIVVRSRR